MSFLNAAHLNSEDKRKFHDGTGGVHQVVNLEPVISGKRFLVLDDEFLIALDIQQILESAGAGSVACVGNAEAALTAINAGVKFDLAVLDFKLSGGSTDSLKIAAALTAQETPFVFLTGMREDPDLRRYPDAPIVEKPYEAPLLIDAVLRAFGLRNSSPGRR